MVPPEGAREELPNEPPLPAEGAVKDLLLPMDGFLKELPEELPLPRKEEVEGLLIPPEGEPKDLLVPTEEPLVRLLETGGLFPLLAEFAWNRPPGRVEFVPFATLPCPLRP